MIKKSIVISIIFLSFVFTTVLLSDEPLLNLVDSYNWCLVRLKKDCGAAIHSQEDLIAFYELIGRKIPKEVTKDLNFEKEAIIVLIGKIDAKAWGLKIDEKRTTFRNGSLNVTVVKYNAPSSRQIQKRNPYKVYRTNPAKIQIQKDPENSDNHLQKVEFTGKYRADNTFTDIEIDECSF